MSTLTYKIINAFTSSSSGGNPAAVLILPSPQTSGSNRISPSTVNGLLSLYPPDDSLQKVATRLNQPMSSFVIPLPDGTLTMRWIDPVREVQLCGHATMATSCYLFSLHPELDELKFWTKYHGQISAYRINSWETSESKNKSKSVSLNDIGVGIEFPEITSFRILGEFDNYRRNILDIFGNACMGDKWVESKVRNVVRDADQRIIIEVSADIDLSGLKVDCNKLEGMMGSSFLIIQMINAQSTPPAYRGEQIRSRVFHAFDGNMHEDAVTGSAHCLIIPFLFTSPNIHRFKAMHPLESLKKDNEGNEVIHVYQCSERGGDLYVSWKKDKKRILIVGQSFEVRDGTIEM